MDTLKERWQRIKNDPELLAEDRRKKRVWAQSEKGKLTARKWAIENLQRNTANKQRWQKEDPNRYCDIQRKHKYKKDKIACLSLFMSQQGLCAICLEPLEFYGNNTVIDHDHKCCPGQSTCGKCIRGFICASHNKGLGHFKDSPKLLRKAADYLESYTNE